MTFEHQKRRHARISVRASSSCRSNQSQIACNGVSRLARHRYLCWAGAMELDHVIQRGHARPRLPLRVPEDPALGDLSCLFRRLGLPKLLECLVNVVGDVSSKAACAGYRCKAPGINEPRREVVLCVHFPKPSRLLVVRVPFMFIRLDVIEPGARGKCRDTRGDLTPVGVGRADAVPRLKSRAANSAGQPKLQLAMVTIPKRGRPGLCPKNCMESSAKKALVQMRF
ncbi:hypothetical protein ACVJGD_000032 [Bradyrhizobium sp. USDA 10063]